jgi:hypothetical protein
MVWLRNRRLWEIIASVSLVVGGFGVYLLIPPKSGVTKENFRRLYKGMMKEEILAILGSEGTEGEPILGWSDDTDNLLRFGSSLCYWKGREGHAWIVFFGNNADGGGFYSNSGEADNHADKPESILVILRRWIGW